MREKKDFMTEEQRRKCHKIIHSVSLVTAGIGGGLAQVPGSDSVAIAPLQIGMIMALGEVFGYNNISENSAEAIFLNRIAEHGGKAVVNFFIGKIPGVGNVIKAATAAAITETIGWSVANDFASKAKNKESL